MRKMIFAKRINHRQLTGLVDVSKNPPEVYCYCSEEVANEILTLQKDFEAMKERKCHIQQNLDKANELLYKNGLKELPYKIDEKSA